MSRLKDHWVYFKFLFPSLRICVPKRRRRRAARSNLLHSITLVETASSFLPAVTRRFEIHTGHLRLTGWRVLFILVLGFLASCKNHTDPDKTYSKFFVVRHAERYPGFNGHLTWYGRERAGDLMRLLKDSGIQKIYVTPFSRTLETADSLISLQKTDTVVYLADTSGADLEHRLKQYKDYGKNILIVGHGNTVPGILRMLGVSYPSDTLPDTVFNRVFEVINDHGKVKMHSFTYGKANLPDTLNTMK